MFKFFAFLLLATFIAGGITYFRFYAPLPEGTQGPIVTPGSSQTNGVNNRSGSCQEFNNYARTTGPTYQEKGETKTYPGAGGITIVDFDTKPRIINRKDRASQQKYGCNCNNTVYDDLDTCIDKCEVTLGCFSGICDPVQSEGNTCVDITYGLSLTPKVQSFVLQWTPPANASTACKQMATAWNQRVRDHEKKHYDAEVAIINKANQEWQNGKMFTGCGKNKAEAEKQADDKFTAQTRDTFQKMSEESDRTDARIHSIEPHTNYLDCSVCQ